MDQKIPENILNKICSAFDEKNYALYLKFFSFISANDPTRYIQILEHTLKNNPTIFNSLVLFCKWLQIVRDQYKTILSKIL